MRTIMATRARCATRLRSRSSAAMTSRPTISSRHTSQSITAVFFLTTNSTAHARCMYPLTHEHPRCVASPRARWWLVTGSMHMRQ